MMPLLSFAAFTPFLLRCRSLLLMPLFLFALLTPLLLFHFFRAFDAFAAYAVIAAFILHYFAATATGRRVIPLMLFLRHATSQHDINNNSETPHGENVMADGKNGTMGNTMNCGQINTMSTRIHVNSRQQRGY